MTDMDSPGNQPNATLHTRTRATSERKANTAVAAGLPALIAGILLLRHAYPVKGLGWILVVTGSGLCFWGSFTLAREKGVQLPAWSRWLLALPAATVAYLSISLLAHSIVGITEYLITGSFNPGFPDWPFLLAWFLVTSLAGSYSSVLAGARTAPTHRFIVGMVLAVACLSVNYVALVTILMGIFGTIETVWTWPIWWVIAWIAGMIEVIAACVRVRRFEITQSGWPYHV